MQPTIIGVDLAKSVFQVHGVDAHGKVIVTRRLRRDGVLSFFANLPACVVGMEACATAHHWAREISKLGHTVHLMPPQYVKPYVKRHKNDQADAEAVCEAVQRPSMRLMLGASPAGTCQSRPRSSRARWSSTGSGRPWSARRRS
jgi:transposase